MPMGNMVVRKAYCFNASRQPICKPAIPSASLGLSGTAAHEPSKKMLGSFPDGDAVLQLRKRHDAGRHCVALSYSATSPICKAEIRNPTLRPTIISMGSSATFPAHAPFSCAPKTARPGGTYSVVFSPVSNNAAGFPLTVSLAMHADAAQPTSRRTRTFSVPAIGLANANALSAGISWASA